MLKTKSLILSAIVAGTFGLTPVQANAGECDALTLKECRDRISDISRAIAWLETKKQENSARTDAVFTSCKESSPAGSDISVVLNCMLDTLGP